MASFGALFATGKSKLHEYDFGITKNWLGISIYLTPTVLLGNMKQWSLNIFHDFVVGLLYKDK